MCGRCGLSPSRRAFVLGAAAAFLCRPALAAPDPTPPQNAISGDEALKRLMDGNARYVANAETPRDYRALRQETVTAQYPIAAVLGCSDSRVPPEVCFDQGPNELFVVRVAGNVLDTDGVASLEYAVAELNVPLVVVLGHTGCGAVTAAVKTATENAVYPGHLPRLVQAILPSVEIARWRGGDLVAGAVRANAQETAIRIRASAPVLSPAIATGRVKLVSAIYDIATGSVALL